MPVSSMSSSCACGTQFRRPICCGVEFGFGFFVSHILNKTGASCSKLTMSLVSDSLKFQMAILQIQVDLLFFVEKSENPLQRFSHFFTKKFAFEVNI